MIDWGRLFYYLMDIQNFKNKPPAYIEDIKIAADEYFKRGSLEEMAKLVATLEEQPKDPCNVSWSRMTMELAALMTEEVCISEIEGENNKIIKDIQTQIAEAEGADEKLQELGQESEQLTSQLMQQLERLSATNEIICHKERLEVTLGAIEEAQAECRCECLKIGADIGPVIDEVLQFKLS